MFCRFNIIADVMFSRVAWDQVGFTLFPFYSFIYLKTKTAVDVFTKESESDGCESRIKVVEYIAMSIEIMILT
jgi:hypothetical protein